MRKLLTRIVLVAAMFWAVSASAAYAEDPLDLDGAYIIDTTSTLTSADFDAIDAARLRLLDAHNTALYVVVVDSFSNPSFGPEWADAVAAENSLQKQDVLLTLAISDREVAYSIDSDFNLNTDRLDTIIDEDMLTHLRADDWAESIVAFSDGVDRALDPGPPWLLIVGGSAASLGAFVAAVKWGRRRAAASKAARIEREEIVALDTRADALLVSLDDSIRTSKQEVGFAQAQFGEDAAEPFLAALTEAEGHLAQAFEKQRTLDDSTPETPAQQRELITAITELCTRGQAVLDEQTQAFNDLRALEKSAPGIRDQLIAGAADLDRRINAAAEVEADLSARFGAAATRDVDGSIDQARRLSSFAAVELDRAGEALTAGKTGIAATRVRSAQQAGGQIDSLLSAIDALAGTLTQAQTQLTAALADLKTDIAGARTIALDDSEQAQELGAAVAKAESVAAEIAGLSPVDALSKVEAADVALTEVATRVTGLAVERDRALAQFDRLRKATIDSLAMADNYIGNRRGSVGFDARDALAAGRRQFAAALASWALESPGEALRSLVTAQKSAQTALETAKAEVVRDLVDSDDDDSSVGGFLGGIFGDSSGSSSGGWSSSRSRSSSSSSSRSSGGSRSSSSSSRSSGGSRSSSRSSGGRRF